MLKTDLYTLSMSKFEVQKLDWDSDFFGYKVGKAVVNNANDNFLEKVRKEVHDFDLCYVYSTYQSFSDLDIFKDEKVIFEISLKSFVFTKQASSVIPYSKEDFTHLILLTFQSGEFSRFRLDPRFNNYEFERLYFEWLLKSVRKVIADEVLVYKNEMQIVGFVTMVKKQDFLEIGLIAIDPKYRGIGIGSLLLAGVFDYALSHQINRVTVSTQRRNVKAIDFYKKNSFREVESIFICHVWK